MKIYGKYIENKILDLQPLHFTELSTDHWKDSVEFDTTFLYTLWNFHWKCSVAISSVTIELKISNIQKRIRVCTNRQK